MIWVILSAIVCMALTIKLTFFTDKQLKGMRFFYRAMLVLASIYAFKQVVDLVYGIEKNVGPLSLIFHTAFFIGAFFIKPEHLPWNAPHDPNSRFHLQDRSLLPRAGICFRCWLRNTWLRCKYCQNTCRAGSCREAQPAPDGAQRDPAKRDRE